MGTGQSWCGPGDSGHRTCLHILLIQRFNKQLCPCAGLWEESNHPILCWIPYSFAQQIFNLDNFFCLFVPISASEGASPGSISFLSLNVQALKFKSVALRVDPISRNENPRIPLGVLPNLLDWEDHLLFDGARAKGRPHAC